MVFGWSGVRTECLLKERNADPFRAAHFLERGGRPGLALHHLRKQSQPDGDHLAFLGQTGHGLLQELLLLPIRFAGVLWKFAKGSSKSRQYLPGVIHVEKIGQRTVLDRKSVV